MTREEKLSKQELEIAMAACCVGTMWDEYEGTENFDHMVRLRLHHLIDLVRKCRPSLPSNLDEAAEKNFETMEVLEHENIFEETHRKIFKAGAEWVAGQGYSKECTVGDMGITYNKIIPHIKDADMITLPDSFKQGDRVIVQIRKA